MRISDWSSDVCSSDLYVPATRWKTTDDPFGHRQVLHCRSAMLRAGIVGGMLCDFILLGGGRCAIVRAREVDGDVLRNTEAKRDRCPHLCACGIAPSPQAGFLQGVVEVRRIAQLAQQKGRK